ncbi:MAG: hypothetical protein HFG65_14755 [Hungatella sp.]|nr:hypothetical protein [Hungatella sp.]
MIKKRQGDRSDSWVVAAAVGGCVLVLAGCVRQTDIPIVTERTEEVLESQEETETGIPAGETETDRQVLIREQADVPEKYRLSFENKDITITADVEVEVPETEKISLKAVEYTTYTEEELERVKEIFGQELGIKEWIPMDSQEGGVRMSFYSPDFAYNLSMGAGGNQEFPIIWLLDTHISDGGNGNEKEDPGDLTECPMSEAERDEVQAVLEEKARQLLQKMGLEDLTLESARWRQLSVSDKFSWTLSGQYGVRLRYSRKFGELPLVSMGQRHSLWEADPQYVEFLYREDGRLLTVKNIGREQLGNTGEYAEFLLPFSSVSQIFEQCMKNMEADVDTGTESYGGKKAHIYLTVTDVKLAYHLECEEQRGDMPLTYEKKGKLVPVWAFYGTVETGEERSSLDEGRKTLLLAIHGENGMIYGK